MSDDFDKTWQSAWTGNKEAKLSKSIISLADRLDIMAEAMKGLSRRNITDRDGRVYTVLAMDSGQVDYPAPWWPVLAQGGYMIRTGRVYLDYGDWDHPLEIANADLVVTIQAERQVWLELDVADPEQPALSLAAGSKWEWAPDIYKLERGPSGLSNLKKAAFPIWRFREGSPVHPGEFQFNENLVGEQFISAPHSIIVWGIRRSLTDDQRNDQTFAPVLVPLT